mgnify:CR=1 FL=1
MTLNGLPSLHPRSCNFSLRRRRRPIWFLLVLLLAAPVVMLRSFGAATDENSPPPLPNTKLAALVRVQLPLTGSADQALQATIRRVRDRLLTQARATQADNRPALVLQLVPLPAVSKPGSSSGESTFERSFALARFLSSREMAGVKTVAFLPESVQGHGVLLAIACEEIVMAPSATLGEAGVAESADGPIPPTMVAAYREIAESQLTMPVALAVGMIDPAGEVLQVEAEDGTHFVLREDLESFSSTREIISEKVLVPAGTLAQFDGREGRRFGFVKYLAADVAGLAKALDTSAESLLADDSISDAWRAVVIDLSGEINAKSVSRVETLLGQSVQQNQANWICLRIDSSGGDLEAGLRLAATLARIDGNSVRTVAYVPAEARGVAAVVALSCDQLAMHPGARLASAAKSALAPGGAEAELAAAVETIRQSLAPQTEQTWSLLASLVDPAIKVSPYRNKTTGEVRLFTTAEAEQQKDAAAWGLGEPFAADKQQLEFLGAEAVEQGLAWRTVDTFDELTQQFGLAGEIANPQPNPALEFVEALATPELAMILLLVAFAGIYIELRTPGLGAGAFVGAVALLLFFWSKYLDGTAGWLEVLLFLAGLAFLLLEVFVLPGFGIFGLGGGALMLASLVLASLTFVRPHSDADMAELANSMGSVALAGLGMLAFVLISRRYFPQAPFLRTMMLEPPEAGERESLEHREALADYSALIGKRGIAKTALRPSGRALIDHELIDVIVEGDPLDSGAPIVVVEARGTRVVVRAVPKN